MGRYWIRNRGRVQGPFTTDRIQGLLRRGRFSRHFHVSEDKKEWYPAEDFPELFRGVGRSSSRDMDDDDDDRAFSGGGSPFDEDDDEDMQPTRTRKGRGGGGRSRPRDEEYDDDDDDLDDDDLEDEEEDDEDDDEWEDDDDDSGVLTGLLDWVESNAKPLAAVLLLLLLGVGWFVFGRESFAQDAADLEMIIEAKTKISTAHVMGANPADWEKLSLSVVESLKPMVDRLNDTASAKDHVKQELLFASRDDIPKMLNELPKGITKAEEHIAKRFSLIESMIKEKKRVSSASVLSLAPTSQPQPAPTPNGSPNQPPQEETNQPGGNAQSAGNAGQQGAPGQPNQQGQNMPANNRNAQNPNGIQQGGVPNQSTNRQSGNPQPNRNQQQNMNGQPGRNQPPQQNSPNNSMENLTPNNGAGSGIPGRPNSAKF